MGAKHNTCACIVRLMLAHGHAGTVICSPAERTVRQAHTDVIQAAATRSSFSLPSPLLLTLLQGAHAPPLVFLILLLLPLLLLAWSPCAWSAAVTGRGQAAHCGSCAWMPGLTQGPPPQHHHCWTQEQATQWLGTPPQKHLPPRCPHLQAAAWRSSAWPLLSRPRYPDYSAHQGSGTSGQQEVRAVGSMVRAATHTAQRRSQWCSHMVS
jgi:hypothetical protein